MEENYSFIKPIYIEKFQVVRCESYITGKKRINTIL